MNKKSGICRTPYETHIKLYSDDFLEHYQSSITQRPNNNTL